MRDFTKKYFHLNSSAVYNSSAKKMTICQKDVKCQKVKHTDYGGGSQKK